MPTSALALHGIDGWLYADHEARLLGPACLITQEAELTAAGAREALVRTVPAHAERLFERYCEIYAQHGAALRPRVMRLYRAYHHIAHALHASQQLDPYGDEAARASLLEAQRLTS